MIFRGSGTALCTPFTNEGVNFSTLEKLIDFQISEGSDALIICGTTGEPPTMTKSEKAAVIECGIKKVANRVPVIAGVGGNNTADCVAMAKIAKDLGADGLLAVTPYYNKCSKSGLIGHFYAIADATDLPVVLYNVPSRTNVNITPDTYVELIAHKNIVAMKEASCDICQIANYARVGRGKDVALYSGNDDHIVPVLSMGGVGVITVLGNIMPRYTHDMVMAYLEGDVEKARDMQLDVLPLVAALFCEVNPIPVKTALKLMGFDMGPFRLPLCEMDFHNKERLVNEMKTLRLLD